MNSIITLVLSENSDKFKSKTPVYQHKAFGKTLREWSEQVFSEVSNKIVFIDALGIEAKLDDISMSDVVLITWANQPLIQPDSIRKLVNKHTFEQNHATALKSSSGGVYAFDSGFFVSEIKESEIVEINREVIQDIFQSMQKKVFSLKEANNELLAVTTRNDLAVVNNELKHRILSDIMKNGVTIVDTASTYIDAEVTIGMDTVILPNTIIEGNSAIGENAIIGPNTRVSNCKVEDGTEVANSVIVGSTVGSDTHIGPFAYLRPGSNIGNKVKIGDFVEIKKSIIGNRTKISHLSYVGDAEVGENVNIGCGVVFVNYDGKNKNKTIVGDNSFIGCNVNLVSPVVIKNDAYIAAGSTITDEVPENALAIARQRQVNKEDWVIKKGLKRE